MPGISIQVIDVSRGAPACGMAVTVHRVAAAVGEAGLLDDAALERGESVAAGRYEVELQAGAYYRAHGLGDGPPAFQETAACRFHVTDPAERVHLPVKLSSWALSVWRGR